MNLLKRSQLVFVICLSWLLLQCCFPWGVLEQLADFLSSIFSNHSYILCLFLWRSKVDLHSFANFSSWLPLWLFLFLPGGVWKGLDWPKWVLREISQGSLSQIEVMQSSLHQGVLCLFEVEGFAMFIFAIEMRLYVKRLVRFVSLVSVLVCRRFRMFPSLFHLFSTRMSIYMEMLKTFEYDKEVVTAGEIFICLPFIIHIACGIG